MSPVEGLNHEADHAVDDLSNSAENHQAHEDRLAYEVQGYTNAEEMRVIKGWEQRLAKAMGKLRQGQVTRNNHRGRPYHVNGIKSIKETQFR